jgi:hypothetical protein
LFLVPKLGAKKNPRVICMWATDSVRWLAHLSLVFVFVFVCHLLLFACSFLTAQSPPPLLSGERSARSSFCRRRFLRVVVSIDWSIDRGHAARASQLQGRVWGGGGRRRCRGHARRANTFKSTRQCLAFHTNVGRPPPRWCWRALVARHLKTRGWAAVA